LVWVIGAPLIGLVGWLMVRLVGGGRWWDGLGIALLGSTVGIAGLWAWTTYTPGTPRPPWVVFILAGALGYGVATAVVHSGRKGQIAAVAVIGVVAVAGTVGAETRPARNREHGFTAVADILLAPDPAVFRTVGADADPADHAVLLRVEPVAGGPAIALTESARPGAWDPPENCGAYLRYTISVGQPAIDNPCTFYPGGGWQRDRTNGVDLVDLRGDTLVVAEPWDATSTVPAATLRSLIEGLRPARRADLVDLHGTT
jgi:hypothetical protein